MFTYRHALKLTIGCRASRPLPTLRKKRVNRLKTSESVRSTQLFEGSNQVSSCCSLKRLTRLDKREVGMSCFAFIKNPDSIQTFFDRILVILQYIPFPNEFVPPPFPFPQHIPQPHIPIC